MVDSVSCIFVATKSDESKASAFAKLIHGNADVLNLAKSLHKEEQARFCGAVRYVKKELLGIEAVAVCRR